MTTEHATSPSVPTVGLSVLLSAALVLSLTGCSGTLGGLEKQTQGVAESPKALALDWRTPASIPSWVPADATRIRYVAATGGSADAAPAAVRATSDSALPRGCTEIERRSVDAFSTSWAPKAFPARVQRCGNWAVMRVDGGWFGWTPLIAEERGRA